MRKRRAPVKLFLPETDAASANHEPRQIGAGSRLALSVGVYPVDRGGMKGGGRGGGVSGERANGRSMHEDRGFLRRGFRTGHVLCNN